LHPEAERITKWRGKNQFYLFARKASHLKKFDGKLPIGLQNESLLAYTEFR
jgi:hypothetical protein